MNEIIRSLKSFKHNPLLLFINLPGLSIALAAFLLLMLYVKHEVSYDKHFPTKERVIRLYNKITEENSSSTSAICMRVAYTDIPKEVPEIEKACQIYRGWGQTVKTPDKQFVNQWSYYTDPEFFDVFGLELLIGNKETALLESNKMVITDELALKLYGNIDCEGEILELDGEKYSISGVIEKMPKTSHIKFDLLCSMNSLPLMYMGGLEFFTYYLINDKTNIEEVSAKISTAYDKPLNKLFNSFNAEGVSGLEPLERIHLYTMADWDLSRKGNIEQIVLIGLLAIFILLIAVFNFINLYIYHGEKRILEIGIRKTLGAGVRSLQFLFYRETAILTFVSLIFAILIAMAALPFFSELVRAPLSINELFAPETIFAILFFIILFIFISGSYPAHYLSRLNITDSIKGGIKSIKRKKWLAVSSVLIQFFISSFLIVSLLVIHAQISFLKEQPVGFAKDKVITISRFDGRIIPKLDAIKEELKKLNFVSSVGSSDHNMGGGCSGQVMYKYGESEESGKGINEYRVHAGFCETLQLELLEGRFFRPNNLDKNGLILNESAVKYFGLEQALQTQFIMFGDEPLEVIGVVKDFVYDSHAGYEIQPLVLAAYTNRVSTIYIKLLGEWNQEKEEAVAQVFKSFMPDYQLHTKVLEEAYNEKYALEDRTFKIISSAAILAIILSFIGMFALSVFNVEKRTKEIGIRKVNGSTSLQILILILGGILKWVVFAMIPAFLLAIVFLNRLLSEFAYHISLSPLYFVIGGFIALCIATLAISIKSIQAATQNPIESLRYE